MLMAVNVNQEILSAAKASSKQVSDRLRLRMGTRPHTPGLALSTIMTCIVKRTH